jgi:hypothetical protein
MPKVFFVDSDGKEIMLDIPDDTTIRDAAVQGGISAIFGTYLGLHPVRHLPCLRRRRVAEQTEST